MQASMQRCNARVQAFKAAPKASIHAKAPTQFAGLRRGNMLDMCNASAQPVSLVS